MTRIALALMLTGCMNITFDQMRKKQHPRDTALPVVRLGTVGDGAAAAVGAASYAVPDSKPLKERTSTC